jgi:hypothetical protein
MNVLVESVLSALTSIDTALGDNVNAIDLQGQLTVSVAVFAIAKATGLSVDEAFEKFKAAAVQVSIDNPDGYQSSDLANAFMAIE